MIPSKGNPCWQRVLDSQKPISSNFVALNMFIFNARLKYRKDPGKEAAIASEVYQFVSKYEKTIKPEDLKALGI